MIMIHYLLSTNKVYKMYKVSYKTKTTLQNYIDYTHIPVLSDTELKLFLNGTYLLEKNVKLLHVQSTVCF